MLTTTKPKDHLVKILLVDDLEDNLLALEGILRRDDVELFRARSGKEALELIMRNEFALAIIDVQMPIMDGFELAELMRGAKRVKSVPIIFVTATAKDHSSLFKGYESGAVDFLSKPLDIHAVRSKANVFIDLYLQKKELKTQLEVITTTQRQQVELLLKLEMAQGELLRSVRVRDEFMSIASHELKTPLTTLKLQCEMRQRTLRKGAVDKFTPERLEKLFNDDQIQLDRIAHLIDDMLDISRINTGKLSMRLEKFDLCKVVRELIERSEPLFAAGQCVVTGKYSAPIIGNWDRFRIEQVIMNLLTNAIRYGNGKPISVQVESLFGGARITVRDQGRGIALENHKRIFQRFERAVGLEITGLGLGLYIVNEILTAHGGSVGLKSELGMGSTFFVDLPLNALIAS